MTNASVAISVIGLVRATNLHRREAISLQHLGSVACIAFHFRPLNAAALIQALSNPSMNVGTSSAGRSMPVSFFDALLNSSSDGPATARARLNVPTSYRFWSSRPGRRCQELWRNLTAAGAAAFTRTQPARLECKSM